nr:histidine phosphatase family protein [Propionibacterium sp.]
MSTRLVLIRHGRTAWNHEGRFQGRADIPLDEHGRAQAGRMAVHVSNLMPAAIVSSDLLRARQTADALASVTGLPVRLDARLQEIDVGSWSGRTIEDAAAEMPDLHDALREGRDFRRSPSGETAVEAGTRVAEVLLELAAESPDRTVAVVGHGLALRMAVLRLVGWDLPTGLGLSGLWNGSWTVLERRERWRILSYNNVAPEPA